MAINLKRAEPLKQESDGSVLILAPVQGKIVSYHASGKSPKEEYLEAKRLRDAAFTAAKQGFRL